MKTKINKLKYVLKYKICYHIRNNCLVYTKQVGIQQMNAYDTNG